MRVAGPFFKRCIVTPRMYQPDFAVYIELAILKAHIAMDTSTVVSILSALAAIISAVYAHLQVSQAKKSSEQAQKAILEASTQNRITALIALKTYYEQSLPEIKKLADHFSTPETYFDTGRNLHAEHEEVRKKLQRVNREIDSFYNLYVPEGGKHGNG